MTIKRESTALHNNQENIRHKLELGRLSPWQESTLDVLAGSIVELSPAPLYKIHDRLTTVNLQASSQASTRTVLKAESCPANPRDHRDGTLRDHPSRVPGSGHRDNKTSNNIRRDTPGHDVSDVVNSG